MILSEVETQELQGTTNQVGVSHSWSPGAAAAARDKERELKQSLQKDSFRQDSFKRKLKISSVPEERQPRWMRARARGIAREGEGSMNEVDEAMEVPPPLQQRHTLRHYVSPEAPETTSISPEEALQRLTISELATKGSLRVNDR